MDITISKLSRCGLEAVDELMKRNSKTLGFLPRAALNDYCSKGGVLAAEASNGELAAYILYASHPAYFRIAQLCVSENFRNRGIAKRLVEKLKESATSQKIIRLRCRRDFPAHELWSKLGFTSFDERPGRSADGHLLVDWYLRLAPDDQLDIFQAKVSDECLDVVVDAQVFFNFYEQDGKRAARPSQALFRDYSTDINLCITDELFNEINRHQDENQRALSRNRAHQFSRVGQDTKPLAERVMHYEDSLRSILPSEKAADRSDIKQLAYTAASDINVFVTEDQSILKKSEKIFNVTNLKILSPTDLIIQLHKSSHQQSYVSSPISGIDLKWRRLSSNDLSSSLFDPFLNQGERKGHFKETLQLFLVSPNRYKCELLYFKNQKVAIRVLENIKNKSITVHLGRVSPCDERSLFETFLVADTVARTVKENLNMVKFKGAPLSPGLVSSLLKIGFRKHDDAFVKFCFSNCLDRQEVLSSITKLCLQCADDYNRMGVLELEKSCSPLIVKSASQRHFLIPIKPKYAMSLFDIDQSAGDLFGGKTNVLLRWENIYYRSKTHHKALEPPCRILWYISGQGYQHIKAVSHLDEAETGTPKKLYKKFKKMGILEWKDLYDMCQGDPSKSIMALKFSHTFLFRKPVSLGDMKSVLGSQISLQSPLMIRKEYFQQLFQLGYHNQS